MELFILLAAYVIVRVGEDVTAAVRKQPPPRHEYRMKKLEKRDNAAQQRGYRPKQQGSFGRYMSGLVADAWDSAHHRRQLMADERDRRRERRITNRIERRQARDQKRDQKHADTTALSEPEQPAPVGFAADPPEPAEPEPAPGGDTTSRTGEQRPSAVTDPDLRDEPDIAGDVPLETAERQGSTEDTENTPSNIIPFPTVTSENTENTASPSRMELPSMNGEVTGLNSAISYAENLSAYCAHTNDQISSVLPTGSDASASCEQARESLAAGGVTGQPLSDVTAVQEQMTEAVAALNQALAQLEAAGAAADSLRDTLTAHLSVQESYAANPEAGSKEFVTAE